jgi:hypothetical protein
MIDLIGMLAYNAALACLPPHPWENQEVRSGLMAAVALEAKDAKIDTTKLGALLSEFPALNAYKDDLEKELLSWVAKIAREGGKAAAEGAIEALHLEELGVKALFGLAHLIFFALL